MVNAKTPQGRQVKMTWVPVRDHDGRVHMEARWQAPSTADKMRPV